MVQSQTATAKQQLLIDGSPLSLSTASAIGRSSSQLVLSKDPRLVSRVRRSSELVRKAVEEGLPVYGVTTGFGGMAEVPVPQAMAGRLQSNLLSFLASGAGQFIEPRHVRLAMALRANVLSQGCSGVRLEIIERLVDYVNSGATPLVRELGSIGASGDLVPLSAIARAVTGDSRDVHVLLDGTEMAGPVALRQLGLAPLELQPKEGLALINGTSFSSAIAANCVYESRKLFSYALAAQAIMLRSLRVRTEPFEEFVQQCKPHPGQVWVAELMRGLLSRDTAERNGAAGAHHQNERLQDQYSLRCLPQYTGPIAEGIKRVQRVVETEMNSVSDNPLIDPSTDRFYQSGNFLGQYVGMAMDDLRRFLGLLAKHLDVQIASLVSPAFNNGLAPSLRGNDELPYNMGLKGLQITGNSIMPLLTHLANPLVEHFPTHAEQFNQNINGLSWGSANLAWRSTELFRHYLSVALLFSLQSIDLQAKLSLGHYDGRSLLSGALASLYESLLDAIGVSPDADRPYVFDDSDQWLEEHLARVEEMLQGEPGEGDSVTRILTSFDSLSCSA